MREGLLASFFVFAAVTLSSGIAFADVQGSTNNNASIDIPDASVAGVPASTSTITITENEIIEEVNFSIEGLAHTWVGDLVATVTHVQSGRSVTLFSRILRDNPNFGVGDESNFQGDYVFSDATNNGLWEEAARGQTNYVLRTTEGDPDDPQTNPGIYNAAAGLTGAPISINDAFAGISTQGEWVLDLSDRNATQVGSFREFSVEFTTTAVPEPSTFVWLIAAATAGIGIRRRRS